MARSIAIRDHNNIPQTIHALDRGITLGLERLGDAALDRIDDGFETGTDAMGNPWPPLSPVTVRLKGHKRILRDTEELREAFGTDVDTTRNRLEVYNSDWKAGIHEYGAPDENIPKRAFLRPASEWVIHDGMDNEFEPVLQAVTGSAMLRTRHIG